DRFRFHGDFRPIAPLLQRFNDLGVRQIQLADPPQRITNDRALGTQLTVVCEMLQLAAAAVVVDVMRTRRRDPSWPGLHDFSRLGAREIAVARERAFTQPDPITWYGARCEHDAAITQPSNAVAAH